MSEAFPSVSLVVPNYNGAKLLPLHTPSLLKAAEAYPGEAEVVVVDDGSSDDSLSVLRDQLPGVRVVVHEVNRGFGAACLTGIEAAKHELCVLLNSDVTAEEGFLKPLVAPFADDPEVFSVSPLILDREGEASKVTVNLPRIKDGDLRWEGVDPDELQRLSALPLDAPLKIYSLFGLGGAIAMRRSRFLEIGGFDPLYVPFYHEDVDLGLCAWRRGWTVRVEPRSRVVHDDGGTINKHFAPYRVKVARRRHRILCGWKHASGDWLKTYDRTLIRRALTKWLSLDRRYYAALLGAWKRRGEALTARAKEESATVVPLGEAFERIRGAWPPPD